MGRAAGDPCSGSGADQAGFKVFAVEVRISGKWGTEPSKRWSVGGCPAIDRVTLENIAADYTVITVINDIEICKPSIAAPYSCSPVRLRPLLCLKTPGFHEAVV